MKSKQLSAINDELHYRIKEEENSLAMASVFDDWRRVANDEAAAWAKQIADEARRSFGRKDSRYRSVTYDPVKLQDAVYLAVCRSFASYAVARRWIGQETAENWISGAVEVFAPKPKEPEQTSRMEDPEVFLRLLKSWYSNPSTRIAETDEDFSKAAMHDGAFRNIGETQYLVLPEEWLEKVYIKEARKGGFI